jgi:hypothetical protein
LSESINLFGVQQGGLTSTLTPSGSFCAWLGALNSFSTGNSTSVKFGEGTSEEGGAAAEVMIRQLTAKLPGKRNQSLART